MKIENNIFNAIMKGNELKEALVFNFKSIDSIDHDVHLTSCGFSGEVLREYGNTFVGRWKIKQ